MEFDQAGKGEFEFVGIERVKDDHLAAGEAQMTNAVEDRLFIVEQVADEDEDNATFDLAGDRHILFTGDTVFMQSIGRTDLWGGSYSEIISSIQKKLMNFDDDTFVIAGHGQSTTIGHERRYNPFLR